MAATRQNTPNRLASIGLTGWSFMFALFVAVFGNHVTSKQWQYLMSIPGDKWSWFAMYGTAALLGMYGWYKGNYGCMAAGLIISGFCCLGICVFYLIAPVFVDDLFTLGWLIWLLGAGVFFYFGAINQSAREW